MVAAQLQLPAGRSPPAAAFRSSLGCTFRSRGWNSSPGTWGLRGPLQVLSNVCEPEKLLGAEGPPRAAPGRPGGSGTRLQQPPALTGSGCPRGKPGLPGALTGPSPRDPPGASALPEPLPTASRAAGARGSPGPGRAGRVPAEQPRAGSARRGRGAALPERGAVGARPGRGGAGRGRGRAGPRLAPGAAD